MAALLPLVANAYFDACIDGIYYNFSEGEAEVTSDNIASYSGSVVIPPSVTNNGNTYPVTSIAEESFLNCVELTSITIPGSVNHIASSAFNGCRSLTAVHIDDIEAWCQIAFGDMRSNPLYFAKHLYMNGKEITDLKIPEGVSVVSGYAFYGCEGLNTITFHRNVTEIGYQSFERCNNLQDVYCYAEKVPEAPSASFPYSGIRNTTLHVPAASLELYQATAPWKRFGTIVALPNTPDVSFTQGQMATIILPTVPDASKGRYYRLEKCEDGQIVFEEELQPKARTPYIIVPTEDFGIYLGTLDLEGCYRDTVSIEGINFIGSYIREEFDCEEGFYIDIIDMTPDCQAQERPVIGALRAYLQVSWNDPYNQGGTKLPGEKMPIVLHDNGTGIASPHMEAGERAAIFDLQGRRRYSKPAHGIYIEGGQKRLR